LTDKWLDLLLQDAPDAMKILLDDMPCDFNAATVGEALDAASTLAEQKGRLIVDVSVDGTSWTESELSRPECTSGGADVVRFTSAAPLELVRQTFADAEDALIEADELQRETAELLQADQRAVSLDKLNEAISIWLQVQEAIVKGSQLVALDLDTVPLERPIGESINGLNERLEQVRGALAQGDVIALSDTLLYEFPAVIQEWRGILQELQHNLERKSP
jgi:hypothetical protein